jgi:hypothetical protein
LPEALRVGTISDREGMMCDWAVREVVGSFSEVTYSGSGVYLKAKNESREKREERERLVLIAL